MRKTPSRIDRTPKPGQLEDAKRLRAIFKARQGERLIGSQERFAEEYDLNSQSMVWQYLSGYIPLNLSAALRFATGLRCDVRDFSPRVADELDALVATRRSAQVAAVAVERPLTADQRRLLTHYDRLAPGERKLMLKMVASMAGAPTPVGAREQAETNDGAIAANDSQGLPKMPAGNKKAGREMPVGKILRKFQDGRGLTPNHNKPNKRQA